MSQSYWMRFLRAQDRLGNAITGGDDEETISHRVARASARGLWWGKVSCWILDKFKYLFGTLLWENHCEKVLAKPNPSDATVPLDAPLEGDANNEVANKFDPKSFIS